MFEELAYYNQRHPSFSSVLERLIGFASARQRVQTEPSSDRATILVPFSGTDSPCGTANFPSQSSGARPRSVGNEQHYASAVPRTNSINKMECYVPTDSSLMGNPSPLVTHNSGNIHFPHGSGSSAGLVAPLTEKKIQVSVLENEDDIAEFQTIMETRHNERQSRLRQQQIPPRSQSAY